MSVTPSPSVYDGYLDASGPGDGGDSGSGDGGPGLGRFLKAIVRVELADGRVAGEAEIDEKRGVVRCELCGYSGPVRFTVKGKADGSSMYFEEAVGKFVPYPANREMHAVVPKFDKNVGITMLTHAAWSYLTTQHGPEGWKNAKLVDEANRAVRDDFNQYVPANYKIADITRLPFLLSDSTKAGSIPDNENGKYGVVISGLGVAAGMFQPQDPAPALEFQRQLADDYCEGKLDETCNGRKVVDDPAKAAYKRTLLSEYLAAGIHRVAASCGSERLESLSPRVTQVRIDAAREPFANQSYSDRTPIWFLRNDGQVFFWSTRKAAVEPYTTPLFRQLFPQGPLLGMTTPLSDGKTTLSRALTAAYTVNGQLSRDQQTATAQQPAHISNYDDVDLLAALDLRNYPIVFGNSSGLGLGQIVRKRGGRVFEEKQTTSFDNGTLAEVSLPDATAVAVGGTQAGRTFYAMQSTGAVYSWGSNANGQLGQANDDLQFQSTTPRQIKLTAAAITGHAGGAFAIDREGNVFAWGTRHPGIDFGLRVALKTAPFGLIEFTKFGAIREIACAEISKCVARSAGGQMIVWGQFYDGAVDLRQTSPTPREIAPVEVPLPADRQAVSVGAAGLNVYALLDDGTLVVVPTLPAQRQLIATRDLVPRASSGSGGLCTAQ
ncbi:MAG TPA: hypothetical protein VFR86_00185 [Burkholderiaceae bacterium]|nr:hypothetical protein [Burkholderiaceae bacterium]